MRCYTLMILLLATLFAGRAIASQPTRTGKTLAEKARPQGFIPNRGQLPNELGEPNAALPWYLSRNAATVGVTPVGLQITWQGSGSAPHAEGGSTANTISAWRADLQLVGAAPEARITARRPTGASFSYYHDHCPQGVVGVPDFSELVAEQVWPGIDWRLAAVPQGLKHEFVLSPGADPALVRMRWQGADKVELTAAGGLSVATPSGFWEENAPVAYQINGADTTWVPAAFTRNGSEVSFQLGSYDPARPLVIDPMVRVWGTYYGGANADAFHDVEIDPSARYYWVGESASAEAALTTAGTHQALHGDAPAGGLTDVLLAKFTADGARLWATFYGGAGVADGGRSIAIDRDGSVFIAGNTATTNGLFGTVNVCQPASGGGQDAFVAKFDATNGQRTWSTYLGGNGTETAGNDLSIDECGNILFIGTTASANYTDSNGASLSGPTDAFVVKLRNFHGGCVWRRLIGGTAIDEGYALDIEGCGEDKNFLFIGGATSSAGLATAGAHQVAYGGGTTDGFIARLSNVTGATIWISYYGGTGVDVVNSLEVDGCGFAYPVGQTDSPAGIATAGTRQPALGGSQDAFAAKFETTGVRRWGTYYGGAGADAGLGISVEGCDASNVYIAGRTASAAGISTPDGWQPAIGGPQDGFAARIDGATGAGRWGSYCGGVNTTARRVLKSWRSDVVIGGTTGGLGAGVGSVAPAVVHQGALGGGQDAFILLLTE